MDNITIIFCNFFHIGDTYFAQPFVKNIIINNPNNDYYIFNNYNTYCYLNEISNIKDINSNIDLKKKIYRILNIYIKDSTIDESNLSINEKINICDFLSVYPMFHILYDNKLKMLLINTWIGSIREVYPLIECNLVSYNESNNLIINEVNNLYDLNIKYDNSINLNLLPDFKKIHIISFLILKNNAFNMNKKIIFYYNYIGKSSQEFPIKNEDEHNFIIKELSKKYIIIVPFKNINLENYILDNNNESIIFAEKLFDFNECYSCKNLYYYAQMANDSDISVYFDNGRSFLYINKTYIINNNNNLRLHFTNNIYYYKNINDERLVPKNFVTCVKIDHFNEIIDYFNNNNL